MTFEDILKVDINQLMVDEAVKEARWLDTTKQGANTRRTKANQDVIGSLAHQIVEQKFKEYGLAFTSTRTEQYNRGDQLDISYESDRIDVKGTEGEPSQQYFFNENFLVFQKQIDDPKFDTLTHLIFCKVASDYSAGWIYGAITTDKFLSLATPVTLKWENQSIKSRFLTPFTDYVFRTGKLG